MKKIRLSTAKLQLGKEKITPLANAGMSKVAGGLPIFSLRGYTCRQTDVWDVMTACVCATGHCGPLGEAPTAGESAACPPAGGSTATG